MQGKVYNERDILRDVLGSEYPFYFKTKEEFQNKLQNLPETFDYKLRDFKSEFQTNLINAMLQSRNHTKFHDQEGIFGGPWLYFMSQGLTYKKDLLYQTHKSLVDGQGSNSWETIRRWVKQWGVKDDPNSRYTKLHIPDDAHEAVRDRPSPAHILGTSMTRSPPPASGPRGHNLKNWPDPLQGR